MEGEYSPLNSKAVFILAKIVLICSWHIQHIWRIPPHHTSSLKAVYIFFFSLCLAKKQLLSVLCYPHQKFTHKYFESSPCFPFFFFFTQLNNQK